MKVARCLFYVFMLFGATNCQPQDNGLVDLREDAVPVSADNSSDNLLVVNYSVSTGHLNYTKCLLHSYWLLQRDSSDEGGRLAQAFSFCGDNKTAVLLEKRKLPPYPQLADTAYLNKFRKLKINFQDPAKCIVEKFKNTDVIMFNEAHDRPQTRAFVLGLLPELKKAGAVNLALETFDEDVANDKVDVYTGHYTSEPVMGQLVREAIRLGYKLIPYEQTQAQRELEKSYNKLENSLNAREYYQALNLYNGIKKGKGTEKTVVLAGYGHISESTEGYDPPFVSMALRFREFSGIDPVTVEQTILLEGHTSNSWTRRLLEKLYTIDNAKAICSDTSLKRIYLHSGNDIFILHPETKYIHGRPDWLLSSEKKLCEIEMPANLKAVLVQAYLKNEIREEKDFDTKIPFDMSFTLDENKVWLSLNEKESYDIVFRNQENKIIHRFSYKAKK